MGWKETCAVDERMRFVMATEQREEAFAVICRRFGVSRRVGYKWLARYQEAGVEGLFDRPRAPRHHPQTIADEIAERCLAVRLSRPGCASCVPVVDAAFRGLGLPYYMGSDKGSPFASRGAGGLSKLSIKLIKAGVIPERIAPGKPQQNGRHERMHLTLLQDTANPPARSLHDQLKRLRDFQRLYNEQRPHQALGNATPADLYTPSSRRFDGILREPEYGDDHEVRRVRHNGDIRWRNGTISVNQALLADPARLPST